MQTTEELPFVCPKCHRRFGWGDGSAPIFLGVVHTLPFDNQPTPCCGHRISGYITRDLEMVLTAAPSQDTNGGDKRSAA
jgi:hypothetical protein